MRYLLRLVSLLVLRDNGALIHGSDLPLNGEMSSCPNARQSAILIPESCASHAVDADIALPSRGYVGARRRVQPGEYGLIAGDMSTAGLQEYSPESADPGNRASHAVDADIVFPSRRYVGVRGRIELGEYGLVAGEMRTAGLQKHSPESLSVVSLEG